MEFKCVNKDCEKVNIVRQFYSVAFKTDSVTGRVMPDLYCDKCKKQLESISDGVSISEKNIWSATEIGSPSKQWTKHGEKSIY